MARLCPAGPQSWDSIGCVLPRLASRREEEIASFIPVAIMFAIRCLFQLFIVGRYSGQFMGTYFPVYHISSVFLCYTKGQISVPVVIRYDSSTHSLSCSLSLTHRQTDSQIDRHRLSFSCLTFLTFSLICSLSLPFSPLTLILSFPPPPPHLSSLGSHKHPSLIILF